MIRDIIWGVGAALVALLLVLSVISRGDVDVESPLEADAWIENPAP